MDAPSTIVTHAKVALCDDSVLVSDANWSYSGLALYNGTSVLVRGDQALAAEYAAWWQAIWDSGSEVR